MTISHICHGRHYFGNYNPSSTSNIIPHNASGCWPKQTSNNYNWIVKCNKITWTGVEDSPVLYHIALEIIVSNNIDRQQPSLWTRVKLLGVSLFPTDSQRCSSNSLWEMFRLRSPLELSRSVFVLQGNINVSFCSWVNIWLLLNWYLCMCETITRIVIVFFYLGIHKINLYMDDHH